MFRAPDWATVMHPDMVAEYRLDTPEVARMLGTNDIHIVRWSRHGKLVVHPGRTRGDSGTRQTVFLNPWRIPGVKSLAFSLTDVMRFAAIVEGPDAEYGDGIEWGALPVQLALEWNIVAALDRHRELGNLDALDKGATP